MWRRPISTLRHGPTPRRIEWVTARATPNVPPKARKRLRTAISFADPARYPARTTATVSRAAIPPPRTRARGGRGGRAAARRPTGATSAAHEVARVPRGRRRAAAPDVRDLRGDEADRGGAGRGGERPRPATALAALRRRLHRRTALMRGAGPAPEDHV